MACSARTTTMNRLTRVRGSADHHLAPCRAVHGVARIRTSRRRTSRRPAKPRSGRVAPSAGKRSVSDAGCTGFCSRKILAKSPHATSNRGQPSHSTTSGRTRIRRRLNRSLSVRAQRRRRRRNGPIRKPASNRQRPCNTPRRSDCTNRQPRRRNKKRVSTRPVSYPPKRRWHRDPK